MRERRAGAELRAAGRGARGGFRRRGRSVGTRTHLGCSKKGEVRELGRTSEILKVALNFAVTW